MGSGVKVKERFEAQRGGSEVVLRNAQLGKEKTTGGNASRQATARKSFGEIPTGSCREGLLVGGADHVEKERGETGEMERGGIGIQVRFIFVWGLGFKCRKCR